MSQRLARICFAFTAVLVAVALAIQIPVSATAKGTHFATPWPNVANLIFFFTIDSNLIVGVTCALLAINLNRTSTVFQVFRFAGILGIAVTGFIYNTVLAGLATLTPWGKVSDTILHIIVPIVAILGWLIFGPRGQTSWRIAALALLFPIIWLAVSLVRGPIVDWYAYPFLYVDTLGYAKVLRNCLAISILVIGLAAAFVGFDSWIKQRLERPRRP
ncbi:hypothetical protein F4553_003985 [Allocatelliglobosispora scoriae]|uniref:F420-dependent oxidoreductase n=1 Tax=Allocatelliglobosispora scoriae TaxID=643052 RepID=A0A841BT71_9ACTN|nr:Pr6Pr family membrane protein [Allocatelliglobosispora scoriae]MBB5870606.1 hypothetical protein [Allocatelliglobosispora scoriae]